MPRDSNFLIWELPQRLCQLPPQLLPGNSFKSLYPKPFPFFTCHNTKILKTEIHLCVINRKKRPRWFSGRNICLPIQEIQVWSLGWEGAHEGREGNAIHSVFLPRKSEGQREPYRLQSLGPKRWTQLSNWTAITNNNSNNRVGKFCVDFISRPCTNLNCLSTW